MVATLNRLFAPEQPGIEVEQRLGPGRRRGVCIVTTGDRIEYEHGFCRIIAADARQLGLRSKRWDRASEYAESRHERIKQSQRHLLEFRLAAEQAKQVLALLPRRNGFSRPTNRQYAIAAAGVVQAVGNVVGEVGMVDRLARGACSITRNREVLTALHALDLSRQRLEEGGRPHDRVGELRSDQRRLERQ